MAQCSGFRDTSAGTADIHLLHVLPITVTGGITPMMSGRRASKPGSRHPSGRQRCLFHIEKDLAHRIRDAKMEEHLDMAKRLARYMFF